MRACSRDRSHTMLHSLFVLMFLCLDCGPPRVWLAEVDVPGESTHGVDGQAIRAREVAACTPGPIRRLVDECFILYADGRSLSWLLL
jgi:hypothetical protein